VIRLENIPKGNDEALDQVHRYLVLVRPEVAGDPVLKLATILWKPAGWFFAINDITVLSADSDRITEVYKIIKNPEG
jgi:hypothetical protein